jgi:DNA-binding PadR family transcriptional regulator
VARCSELEGFTLGLVWESGPCSAYDVRRILAESPSTQWSGSAGAIYPVLRRLQKRGWVTVRAERNHARRRRAYAISPAGLAVLRAWTAGLAGDTVTVTYDPLRSRARFLGCLAPASRTKWVAAADAVLDEVEASVARWNAKFGGKSDPAAAWLTRSGELDCKARRQWLDEIGRDLSKLRAK